MLLGGCHMLISKLRTHLLAIPRDHCARLSSTCKSLRVCTSAASNHPHPPIQPRSWEEWQLYCQFPFKALWWLIAILCCFYQVGQVVQTSSNICTYLPCAQDLVQLLASLCNVSSNIRLQRFFLNRGQRRQPGGWHDLATEVAVLFGS